MASSDYNRLVKRAKAAEEYARNLAAALGNYRGLSDYLQRNEPSFFDGFVVLNLRWQLLHLLILRSCALMSPSLPSSRGFRTDATLPVIAQALNESSLRREVIDEARRSVHENHVGWDSEAKAEWAKAKLNRFRRAMRHTDVQSMNSFRNAIVAHSTTRKPTPLQIAKINRASEQVLRITDSLAFAVGEDPDLIGRANIHHQAAQRFFQRYLHSENE